MVIPGSAFLPQPPNPNRLTGPAPWVIPAPGVWSPQITKTITTFRLCACMGKCWGCGNCKCVCTCNHEARPLRPEDV